METLVKRRGARSPTEVQWLRRLSVVVGAIAASAVLPGVAWTQADPDLQQTARGSLSLSEAVERALQASPELAALEDEIRGREARTLQAGLIPNPEVEIEIEDFAGSGDLRGFDQAESTLAFSQAIEVGGKRSKRRRSAELDTEVARLELEVARAELVALVGRTFTTVLIEQEHLRLNDELVNLTEATEQAVAQLVQAGAVPAVDRTRAGVEAGIARIERSGARRSLASARAQLAALWAATTPDFAGVVANIQVTEPSALARLSEEIPRNPGILRWEREIERREAIAELENARRTPDITARAGVRRIEESEDSALVVSLAVPFPLFDQNQGSRTAALSDAAKARNERKAAELRLRSEIVAAYQAAITRYEELTELRRVVLPDARQAYEELQTGYRQGRFRSTDVFDALRRLFELRDRELEALRGYLISKVELERLVGAPEDASGSRQP